MATINFEDLNTRKYAFGLFIFLLFLLLLIYISNKIAANKLNCERIVRIRNTDNNIVNQFYNLQELARNNYFKGVIQLQNKTIDYNYKLKDFYIKTAHNCFCNGPYKNGHVNSCALKHCASYGVRALDMQIFSKDNVPVIGASSLDKNVFKESFNHIEFKTALQDIDGIFYRSDTFIDDANQEVKNNLRKDPLFLILRIHYGNDNPTKTTRSNQVKFYNKIYNALVEQFEVSKFASTELKLIYGGSYERSEVIPNMSMEDTKEKLFIFVILNDEPNYSIIKESKLDKLVNLYGDELDQYRFNEIYDSAGAYNINQYKAKYALTVCLPALSSNYNNYDFTQSLKKGTQFVAMNYQNNDSYLRYYNDFFIEQYGSKNNKITSPYIKKPDHMISLPLTLTMQ